MRIRVARQRAAWTIALVLVLVPVQQSLSSSTASAEPRIVQIKCHAYTRSWWVAKVTECPRNGYVKLWDSYTGKYSASIAIDNMYNNPKRYDTVAELEKATQTANWMFAAIDNVLRSIAETMRALIRRG